MDTAFYVKETKSLVLTDVLEKVSNKPVPVATIDPEPLYVRAMDKQGESKPMTSETRSQGGAKPFCLVCCSQPGLGGRGKFPYRTPRMIY